MQTHPLKKDPAILAAEGPDPCALDVWCARDAEGNVLGAAVSFGCHATCNYRTNKRWSADYPGQVCQNLSAALGQVPVLFWSSAAGNACPVNPLDDTRIELGDIWAVAMGEAISAAAVNLLNSGSTTSVEASPGGYGSSQMSLPEQLLRPFLLQPPAPLGFTNNVRIRTESSVVAIPYRVISPKQLAWAERTHTEWVDHAQLEPPELSEYGTELYGRCLPPMVSLQELMQTAWYERFSATQILQLNAQVAEARQEQVPAAEESEKLQMPAVSSEFTAHQLKERFVKPLRVQPSVDFEMRAVAVGAGCAVVAVPCELFVEIEDSIKASSPFKSTTVVTLASGYHGYIPTEEAFSRFGSYETQTLSLSKLCESAGGLVADAAVRLLESLFLQAQDNSEVFWTGNSEPLREVADVERPLPQRLGGSLESPTQ